MRKALDVLRTIVGAVLGALAAGALWQGMTSRAGLHWLEPAAALTRLSNVAGAVALVGAIAMPLALAWIYARWFDALLTGWAMVRGAKFGLIGWTWCTGILLLVQQCTVNTLRVERPVMFGLGLLAVSVTFGSVVGLVYGAGRRYDDYRAGLAYGVSNRLTLA